MNALDALDRLLGPVLRAKNRIVGRAQARAQLAGAQRKRLVIAAAGICPPGWVATDRVFLDVLSQADWERLVPRDSLDAILAEHVWEHLEPDDARRAAANCHRFLRPGGYLRVAVPDGLHPDPAYIDAVRVGSRAGGDHRVLYRHDTLAAVFLGAGFAVRLYEYFDDSGRFHAEPWDARDGLVWRSLRFDERNRDGQPRYTSIVLDAIKDAGVG